MYPVAIEMYRPPLPWSEIVRYGPLAGMPINPSHSQVTGQSYNSYISNQLRAGGASNVSPDPTVNMRVAAAKWSAAKKKGRGAK
jgi:hypothetical protein